MSRRACVTPVVLSAEQHTRALQTARARLQARYAAAARAIPAPRDDTLVTTRITRRLVAEAAAVIDADPDLPRWIAERLAATNQRAGRPSDLCVRTGLILFWVLAVLTREFNVFALAHMLCDMDWRDRRELGIDYLRNGTPTQLSYDQLLEFLHDLAATFDAWDDTLDDTDDGWAVRDQRAQDLQELADRLIACSTAAAPMWRGDGAIDATMKWAWEQPPGKNDKKPTTGKSGDGDSPLSVGDIVAAAGGPEAAGMVVEDAAATTRRAVAGRIKRKKRWPRTWSCGAMWVGRSNRTKAVHGYADHVVTRTDADGPNLVEAFSITPANAHARAAGLPLLQRLHARRSTDPAVTDAVAAGTARFLGDISADPAYSDAPEWPLALRALGASPVMRLHRTNQQPAEMIEIAPGVEVVNFFGRVFCPCAEHTGLLELRFPNFPYTLKELHTFWDELAKLRPFQWRPNGHPRPDGTRQLLRVHDVGPDGQPGGCEHCTHADGTPVRDHDGRPRARCCTKASRRFAADEVPYWQDELFGDPAWYADWNRRNVVEGTFGIVKAVSLINFGHDYHRHVGLAHETIITAFMLCAYNFHMLRTWRVRAGLEDEPAAPTPRVTATLPPRQHLAPPRAARRGPKGLEILGAPRAGP